MREALRLIGRVPTSSGPVVLRMSVGIHSGDFDFFLVGNPEIHRELLISGPDASITAETESAAAAGQIGLSATTAGLLDPRVLGPALSWGRLLRFAPDVDPVPVEEPSARRLAPTDALPPPIRAHLLGGAIQPEHRLITVAFVQFSGTDALLTSEGPGALAEALDDVVRNVQHACADHDITFFESDINRDGGKIMLTAGAPRSADHDEERMLRVARKVLDRAGRLPLRIGINRGHVFAGDFGPSFRRTFSVKGDSINLAARVMGKALPGQVLATPEVVARSHTLFRTTELPAFLVKGKSLPVRAVEVGPLLGTRQGARATLPLVGRDDEMAVLARSLTDVRTGRGQLVEVVGPAGIGKSRLVSELLSAVEDFRVVVVACEQYESATPYAVLGRLLREVMGVPPGADAAEVADVLTSTSRRMPRTSWPGCPSSASPSTSSCRRPERPGTSERSSSWPGSGSWWSSSWASCSSTRPCILVEDAHTMDESSALVLTELVDELAGRPWLLVVTRRDDATGFVPGDGSGVLSVRPRPLDAAEAWRFVQVALDEHPLPRQAMADLVERGGGNPMFLEALVLDAGLTGSVVDLPESVEGLVTSQIDRLRPADRTVLRYAAVLGTTVDEEAVARLLADDGGGLDPGAIDRLADFLVRDRSGGTRFRNALARDVAYEGLPYRHRTALHARVGNTIEASASVPEEQCELLSLHFFHAGEHAKAWRYSVLAGDRALAKYALGEAIAFFARAARSTPHHEPVDRHEVARVHEQLADARWLVGLPQEAAAAYALARKDLRDDPVGLARIIEKEARIDQRHRKHSQAMRRISRGLHQLDGIAGADGEMARSLLARRYADSLFSQGRVDEALRWADVAARAAEESADKDTLAKAYEVLNYIHAGSGRPEPFPYGLMALQAYVELGNLRHQGWCLNNLAMQDFSAGQWDESLDKFRRATDIFRRIGDTAAEGNAAYNEAEILVRQRRYSDAGGICSPTWCASPGPSRTRSWWRSPSGSPPACWPERTTSTGPSPWLRDARDRFDRLGEAAEVVATDLVLVEILQGAAADQPKPPRYSISSTELPGPPPPCTDSVGGSRLMPAVPTEARELYAVALAAAEEAGDRLEQGLAWPPSLRSRRTTRRHLGAPGREILHSIGVVRPSGE